MSGKKKKIVLITSLSAALIIAAAFGLLVFNGIILLNNPSREDYPIRGVDVSSYQGEIDWETLSAQDIQFAFIKATEGSSSKDPNFSENYENAQKTKLRIGAYHFFSFDSPGESQAENFIESVPKTENMLPPVVDVEFYGDKEQNPPDSESVEKELSVFLNVIEKHYGTKPIIYAAERSYNMFISEKYDGYDIWIRNVFTSPTLSDGRKWTFWQYTDRAVLDGYKGDEKFIDMNVFYGSKDEWGGLA